jgi:hypothetical protein
MSATAPVPPTERLAAILAWLAGCVAEQGNRKRLAGPLVVAIWTRLRWISARFRAVAATPIPPPRPARAKPAAHDTAPQPASPPPAARPPRRKPAMPYGPRWLLRLIPGAALSLAQLEALLCEPEMAALLAADPRKRRILRPLCWALGVRSSLAPPPRRGRKPHTAAPNPGEPDAGPGVVAGEFAPPAGRRGRRKRFNLRGRDLLTRLRMGPSPFWA